VGLTVREKGGGGAQCKIKTVSLILSHVVLGGKDKGRLGKTEKVRIECSKKERTGKLTVKRHK